MLIATKELAQGTYYVKLTNGEFSKSLSLVLVK